MTKLSDTGLIAAEDLYYLLSGNEPIKILDATYSVPGGIMSPEQAFLTRRIDGAQFFDIDVVADQESPLPHMAPSPEYFADCVSAMGISSTDHVVIYDQSGAYMASSRAWWLFRLFGHDNVYVLDGGIVGWIEGGYRTVDGPADAPALGNFKASFRPDLVVSKDDLLGNLDTKEFTVIDARPAARFYGQMPEPRPGMRAGHIPGSINLPFPETLQRLDRRYTEGAALGPIHENHNGMKDKSELNEIFANIGISHETGKIAVSCGSGVTACTIALALFAAQGTESAIYDGSWSEWGMEDSGTPVELSA